jgi:hypothetical protein
VDATAADAEGDSPRLRVAAFIADYHQIWQQSLRSVDRNPSAPSVDLTRMPDSAEDFAAMFSQGLQNWLRASSATAALDLDLWATLSAQLDRHFASSPGPRSLTTNVLRPPHVPAEEAVSSEERSGDAGMVRTVMNDPQQTIYYTYRLTRLDGSWLIDTLSESYDPPHTPILSRDEVAQLLAGVGPDTPLPELPGDAGDLDALFAGADDVVELGTLTTSGLLTVHDLGWVRWDVAPLTRSVPPGTYPVTVARSADGVNRALRLKLASSQPVEWLPAERVDTGDVVSVDAGNVAILDFTALASRDAEEAEGILERMTPSILNGPGAVFSLDDGAPDAVVVESGIGDGGYPIYWGLAADGSLTDLVVDFLTASEQPT